MKRNFSAVILLAIMLALSFSTVSQAASMPVGGCPGSFTLMEVMTHDAMEHTHVGLTMDLNHDGYLCMSPATSTIHVHVDNVIVTP